MDIYNKTYKDFEESEWCVFLFVIKVTALLLSIGLVYLLFKSNIFKL